MKPLNMQGSRPRRCTTGFVAIVSMISFLAFSPTALADTVRITAIWDTYTDTLATGLKLLRSDQPGPAGSVTVAPDIPTDSTRWSFDVDVSPGETLYLAMQARNARRPVGDPARFSVLTSWVPWSYRVVVPPAGVSGFGIVGVEVIVP